MELSRLRPLPWLVSGRDHLHSSKVLRPLAPVKVQKTLLGSETLLGISSRCQGGYKGAYTISGRAGEAGGALSPRTHLQSSSQAAGSPCPCSCHSSLRSWGRGPGDCCRETPISHALACPQETGGRTGRGALPHFHAGNLTHLFLTKSFFLINLFS